MVVSRSLLHSTSTLLLSGGRGWKCSSEFQQLASETILFTILVLLLTFLLIWCSLLAVFLFRMLLVRK